MAQPYFMTEAPPAMSVKANLCLRDIGDERDRLIIHSHGGAGGQHGFKATATLSPGEF